MPMGMADVATVLFEKHMKLDAKTQHGPIVIALSYLQGMDRC